MNSGNLITVITNGGRPNVQGSVHISGTILVEMCCGDMLSDICLAVSLTSAKCLTIITAFRLLLEDTAIQERLISR